MWPNIVGIKVSNPNLLRLQEYLEVGGKGFVICYGVEGLMLPGLVLGAQAQILGNSNAFPEAFCGLYDAFVAGDVEQARKQQRMINRICLVLRDGLHPAYYKAALKLRGVPVGRVRPPMRELTPEELKELEQGIQELPGHW